MDDATTCDAMMEGALRFTQRRRGYRFGVDAMLLGAGLAPQEGARLLDLGCGVGVVGQVAAALHPSWSVVGLEVQPALAALAADNARLNGLEGRWSGVLGDAREVASWQARRGSGGEVAEVPWGSLIAPGFDRIVINPPFYPTPSGHLNPDDERAAARHLLHGALEELMRAARLLLRPGGAARVIFPAERLLELLAALQAGGLRTRRVRPIHAFAEAPAKLVLVDAAPRGRQELELAPGFVLFAAPGVYTEAAQALLSRQGLVL